MVWRSSVKLSKNIPNLEEKNYDFIFEQLVFDVFVIQRRDLKKQLSSEVLPRIINVL